MQNAQILGNVGQQPELRYTDSGRQVTSVGIAVHTSADAPPIWWDATIWGEEAARFVERINKGDRILISGQMEISRRQHPETGELQLRTKIKSVKDYMVISRARKPEPVEDPTPTPTEEFVPAGEGPADVTSDDTPF